MAFTTLPEIFFIRHGQTAWNAERRYQGQMDIPLDATGQEQADANGVRLRALFAHKGYDPESFAWAASPLGRTRETMARVRAAFDQKLPDTVFDERLVEISFGVYEGALLSELGPVGMRPMGERDESYWFFKPEKGENYEDLTARVRPFIEDIAQPSVVVAHGGVARVFAHQIAGISRHDLVNWPIPQDAILHFIGGEMAVLPAGE